MFSIILRTKILEPVVSRIYTNHKKHSEIFNNISHNTVNYVKAKITRNIGTRNLKKNNRHASVPKTHKIRLEKNFQIALNNPGIEQ